MAQNKLFNLEQKVKESAQKYYTDGTSEMSDAEFDAAVEEIRKMNPDSPVVNNVGWGYNVDEDSTPGQRVKHKYGKADSLMKAYNLGEVRKSLRGVSLLNTLKIDGLSVVLYYEHGNLVQALTRGDGDTGIDITDKCKQISGCEEYLLDREFTGAVRGEIVMPNDIWEIFKDQHPDAKNSRNSAAGIINSKEITEDLDCLLCVVYRVVGIDKSIADKFYMSMIDVYQWLLRNFMSVVPCETCTIDDDNEQFIRHMKSLKDEWESSGLPNDGIVMTNLNLTYHEDTGYVSYDAQAFKFESEQKTTRVTKVEWNMTKNRLAMPRLHVLPVQLAGTTVVHATGYNAQWIKENGIGVGAEVVLEKRGEIIPNVMKVTKKVEPELPTHCPECNTLLEWDGVSLKCPNTNCSNAAKQDLIVWLDNIAPVKGLGDSLRFKFLEAFLTSDEDLSIETVMNFPATGRHLYFSGSRGGHKKLVSEMLDKLFNPDIRIPSQKAIQALNVPRFGELTAEKFSENKDLFRAIMECACSGCELPDYSNILGVANMASVRKHLSKFKRLQYIWDRIDFTKASSAILGEKGKVAITGKLSVPRKELEAELRSAGYEPGEISKDTKFLITDNPESSSSKNRKATEWGITKITEEEFRSKYM